MNLNIEMPFSKELYYQLVGELMQAEADQHDVLMVTQANIVAHFRPTRTPQTSRLIHDTAEYFGIEVDDLLNSTAFDSVLGLYLNQLLAELTFFIEQDKDFVTTFCIEAAPIYAVQIIKRNVPEVQFLLEVTGKDK